MLSRLFRYFSEYKMLVYNLIFQLLNNVINVKYFIEISI